MLFPPAPLFKENILRAARNKSGERSGVSPAVSLFLYRQADACRSPSVRMPHNRCLPLCGSCANLFAAKVSLKRQIARFAEVMSPGRFKVCMAWGLRSQKSRSWRWCASQFAGKGCMYLISRALAYVVFDYRCRQE